MACNHVKRQFSANSRLVHVVFRIELGLDEDNAEYHWEFWIYYGQNENSHWNGQLYLFPHFPKSIFWLRKIYIRNWRISLGHLTTPHVFSYMLRVIVYYCICIVYIKEIKRTLTGSRKEMMFRVLFHDYSVWFRIYSGLAEGYKYKWGHLKMTYFLSCLYGTHNNIRNRSHSQKIGSAWINEIGQISFIEGVFRALNKLVYTETLPDIWAPSAVFPKLTWLP